MEVNTQALKQQQQQTLKVAVLSATNAVIASPDLSCRSVKMIVTRLSYLTDFWAQSTARYYIRTEGDFHKEKYSWKDQ